MHKVLNIIILTTILILTITPLSLAAWQLSLEVSTPDPKSDTGSALNRLSIGTDPAATDGYDNSLDTLALLDGPVQAYLFHPEYPSSQQKLWRDYRNDNLPQEWDIEVTSTEVNNPTSITWELDAPSNLNFTLIDKDSNQEIVMTSSMEYSYSNTTTTPKRFLLKVTDSLNSAGMDSSGGGSKGGGCGYIKNMGKKGEDSIYNYGQITLNMLILIIPLLLSFKNYARRFSTVREKRNNIANPALDYRTGISHNVKINPLRYTLIILISISPILTACGVDNGGGSSTQQNISTTLAWDAPITNIDGTDLTDLAGYKIYYGTAPGNYPEVVDINDPSVSQYSIENLSPGTYYFAATAYDSSGNESGYSNEVSKILN